MEHIFKTTLTDTELRSLVREEIEAYDKSKQTEEDIYIDIKTAADFLEKKVSYLYQLVHRKAIPFHKRGKKTLFKKSELTKWDQERKTGEVK